MKHYRTIGAWVEDLPKTGKNVFTKSEVVKQFPDMANNNVRNMLYRLCKKRKIQSVWHDFYVVILPEYGMAGIPPPIDYIDQLMKYLSKDYYISLLSAARFHGAAHQAPMEFFIVTDSRVLRDKRKGDIKINFITKKHIPALYIKQVTTNSGYANISCPELTAIDLIIYEKQIGGINRVATVLSELAEVLRFDYLSVAFLKSLNGAVIQRLGYILDFLNFENLSNDLFRKSKDAGLKFRKYPLSLHSEKILCDDYQVNNKWKIIINEEIALDDL